MKDFMLFMFATTGGFALSGIVANLYRIVTGKPDRGKLPYYVAMVLMGPSIVFENATRSVRAGKCSRVTYGFFVALTGYWAFALGLLAIQLGLFAHILNRAPMLIP